MSPVPAKREQERPALGKLSAVDHDETPFTFRIILFDVLQIINITYVINTIDLYLWVYD